MTHQRTRATALAAAVLCLGLAFAVRLLASNAGVLDSSGPLAQYSGTALYGTLILAGVYLLLPAIRPLTAGAAALGFCWAVELFQLTGIPADLSARSVLARLALGIQFDPADLAWYAVGIIPPVVVLALRARHRARTTPSTVAPRL
ncbi:DUF2809 domain-containing protein [Paractinoplanes lichenicola]|uniref:ribosomal maturation YjgA family protein n=1 Tax=Paractinoplanes lichenicola TaxID=2802976 RepID=UPI0027DDD354|nr:DUF2809 domain-containing protein [Actinoplanes lichenicola]